MIMKKIAFIGTGNLASSIIKGVLSSGLTPSENIFIFDVDYSKSSALGLSFSLNVCKSAADAAMQADVCVVAVKPDCIKSALDSISSSTEFVISTAAGVDISTIKSCLSDNAVAVRIMPNINAAVGMAMTAFCSTENITVEQEQFVFDFCSSFGECMKLDEKHFGTFTAVAGSAPAFVYEFINDLAFAGVKNGLTRADALNISVQTVLGSATAVKNMKLHPSELTDMVCSPAGTTVEGVSALREFGFDNAIIKAVDRTVIKDKALKK